MLLLFGRVPVDDRVHERARQVREILTRPGVGILEISSPPR
ncbi:hypothetical protein ACWEQO_05165 [Streptomyces sp. NPDC004051]